MDPRLERVLAQAKTLADRAEAAIEKEAPKLREQIRPHAEKLKTKATQALLDALRKRPSPK